MKTLILTTLEWNFEAMEVVGEIPEPSRCGSCGNKVKLEPTGGHIVCLKVAISINAGKKLILSRALDEFDFSAPGQTIGQLGDQSRHRIIRSEAEAHYMLKLSGRYDPSKLNIFQEHLLLNNVVIPGWGGTYDGKPFRFVSYSDGTRKHLSEYAR